MNNIVKVMEELCNILEDFSSTDIEAKNKEFLKADKKANDLIRLRRKATKKFYDLVGKAPSEEVKKARKTEENLASKASDAVKDFYAKNKEQQELKKQGIKGVISREFDTAPSRKGGRGYYFQVLRTSESLKLIEEAFGLMTSLFEVDDKKDNEETNKLKREIKDKEGNKVNVVSVEDELFPYSGDAKQQFNQKVIAKINDMIEGKATLEELIQFIQQKKPFKKVQGK